MKKIILTCLMVVTFLTLGVNALETKKDHENKIEELDQEVGELKDKLNILSYSLKQAEIEEAEAKMQEYVKEKEKTETKSSIKIFEVCNTKYTYLINFENGVITQTNNETKDYIELCGIDNTNLDKLQKVIIYDLGEKSNEDIIYTMSKTFAMEEIVRLKHINKSLNEYLGEILDEVINKAGV